MSLLKAGPPAFNPRLVIFDKDGTLIHFDAMWGGWVTELARRLEAETRFLPRNRVSASNRRASSVTQAPHIASKWISVPSLSKMMSL